MHPPELMKTDRLILRRPKPSDSEALFREYAADVEVTRYLSWPTHRSVEDTKEFLRNAERWWTEGSAFTWVLQLHGEPGPCGTAGEDPGDHGIELGYVLARRLWGRGLMTEVVTLLRDQFLDKPDVHRVWAICDVENRASARVLEKAGFEHEGTLRRWAVHPNVSSEPRDAEVYSRVR